MRFLIILSILFSFISCSKYDKVSYLKNKEKLITSQDGSFWCWVASAEAMFKHFNVEYKQDDIMKKMFNTNHLPPQIYLMPYSALPYNMDLYFQSKILGDDNLTSRLTDFSNIPNFIDMNLPVMVMFNNHVSVIVGYRLSKGIYEYQIMDPGYKIEKLDSPFKWKTEESLSQINPHLPSNFFVMYEISKKDEIDKFYQ